jgi:penicillin amidase
MHLRLLQAILLIAPALAAADPARMARSVTIVRDNWGVPHIYGSSDAAVVFGLMYAQAEDNFWQLEHAYIRALGRLAEVEGPNGLMNDVGVRLSRAVERAREEYNRASKDTRELCDAFAAGLNYYLAKHPDVKPVLITRFEPWDILAMQRERGFGPATAAGITMAEISREFPGLTGRAAAPEPPTAADPEEGSNMWALGPSRTASRRAMLLINPHIGFFGDGQRYEAHLIGKRLRVSGFAILGTPYIRSGFDGQHGWSHTNNYADIADVYLETFDDPSNPLSYKWGTSRKEAVAWSVEIPVKTANGVEKRAFRLRRTHHGPIVGIRDGRPVAVRTAASDITGTLEQRVAMARARNLAEFKQALAMRSLTGSNTIYADRDGNIFYLHGNAIPKRDPKFDWSKPVDGSDPATDWQGLHAFEELPQLANPPAGFLQNCNSTPFEMTENTGLDRSRYPAYMVPEPQTPRARNSMRILSGSRTFSFEEFVRIVFDTTAVMAEETLGPLFSTWTKFRAEDPQRARPLNDLIAELQSWNRVSTVDSVAMTLYMRLLQELPRTRQNGGEFAAMVALDNVRRRLERDHGGWRVPWGEVNRLQRVHTSGNLEQFSDDRPSLPVAGAPGATGSLFVFNTRSSSDAKRSYGFSGNTYVAAIEFGKRIDSRSLLVFGQTADPKSKHHFDQGPLYSEKRFKPAWYYKADVRRNAERTYHPGE